jgi:hypothetical protein
MIIRSLGVAVAAAVLMTPHAFAQSPQASAKRYEFSFIGGTDRLTRDSGASQQLAVAARLLMRQGWREQIRFQIVGYVPTNCTRDFACADAGLLRNRVESLVRALADRLPASASRDALTRLSWLGTAHQSEAKRDMPRLAINPVQRRGPTLHCPAQVEILDPELPGSVENPEEVLWTSATPGRAIAVGAAAHVRFVEGVDPKEFRELIAAQTVGGPPEQLQLGLPDSGKYPMFELKLSKGTLIIKLSTTGDQLARSDPSDNRAVGDLVMPWTGAELAASPDEGCAFKFER